MIPEPCPTEMPRCTDAARLLVTAAVSTGSRAPSHPSNTPTAHGHFLLFANAFHHQIKHQKTTPKNKDLRATTAFS